MGGNKAAVYNKPGEIGIEVRDLEVPEPGPGQVLIKYSHSGVCHSDLSLMCHHWPMFAPAIYEGRVGGHEGVGKVVKLGAGVTQVKEGDVVGSKWISSCCESCELCLSGRDAFCTSAAVNGGTVDGTFQQYAVQPASYVTPIPASLAPEDACVLLCGGVTIYKALKVAGLQAGQWVAIAGGGGGLGSLGIQYAKSMGFRVIAIDATDKAKLCKDLGAEVFIDFTKENVTEAAQAATDGLGPHAFIVASAARQSYKTAMSLPRTGGTVVCVGIPGPDTPIDVEVEGIIYKDLRLRGSAVGTRLDAIEALAFCARGQVKPTVTVQPLDKLQECFTKMAAGQVQGRFVVEIPA